MDKDATRTPAWTTDDDLARLVPASPGGYLESALVALELGRRAAERLTPENVMEFHKFLERLAELQPRNRYARAWLEAVNAGSERLREVLTDTSDWGQTMRSYVVFRPFVPREESMQVRRAIEHAPPATHGRKP